MLRFVAQALSFKKGSHIGKSECNAVFPNGIGVRRAPLECVEHQQDRFRGTAGDFSKEWLHLVLRHRNEQQVIGLGSVEGGDGSNLCGTSV